MRVVPFSMPSSDLRRQAILRAREEVAKTILHKDYTVLTHRDQNAVNQWVYAAVHAYDQAGHEVARLGRAYLAVKDLSPLRSDIEDIVGHALGAFRLAVQGISEPLPVGNPRRAELEPEAHRRKVS